MDTDERAPLRDRLQDVATANAAKAVRKFEAKRGLMPRRIDIERNTPEEKLIRKAAFKIEELGAHPMLTKVVTLLGNAREVLADWIDGERYDPSRGEIRIPATDEDRRIMGTSEAARLALAEKAREWREVRQPSIATRAQHRDTERREHQVRFELANLALHWLWHEEHPERADITGTPSTK